MRVLLGRRGDERLQRVLVRARGAEPTYGPVGRMLAPDVAADVDLSRQLGAGRAVFDRAVAHLRRLGPQRDVFTVWPPDATATLGATAVVVLAVGPVALTAVDRIVAVVDEPDRWGFAYGTLPGHPEVGEEAFVVTLAADGTVTARVTARAHLALPLGRLVQRVLAPIQRRAARAYLASLAAACA